MLVLDAKMLVKGAVLSLALGSNSSPLLVAAVQPTAPQSSTETYETYPSPLTSNHDPAQKGEILHIAYN